MDAREIHEHNEARADEDKMIEEDIKKTQEFSTDNKKLNINKLDLHDHDDLKQLRGVNLMRYLKQVCSNTFNKASDDPESLSVETVEPVRRVLSYITFNDLGIELPINFTNPLDIAYFHVCEEESYSIGVFVLPPGAVIPLHDHPHMCVISKLLFGSVRTLSFDWLEKNNDHSQGGVALSVHNSVWEAPHVASLFPYHGGNIHMFKAHTDIGCAFIDVLAPPYYDNQRDCTYYKPTSKTSYLGRQLTFLKPTRPPSKFVVRGHPFTLFNQQSSQEEKLQSSDDDDMDTS